jgi:hypothetical protein
MMINSVWRSVHPGFTEPTAGLMVVYLVRAGKTGFGPSFPARVMGVDQP